MPDAVDCEGNERKESASKPKREADYAVNWRLPGYLYIAFFEEWGGGDIVRVADMTIAARSRHSRP